MRVYQGGRIAGIELLQQGGDAAVRLYLRRARQKMLCQVGQLRQSFALLMIRPAPAHGAAGKPGSGQAKPDALAATLALLAAGIECYLVRVAQDDLFEQLGDKTRLPGRAGCIYQTILLRLAAAGEVHSLQTRACLIATGAEGLFDKTLHGAFKARQLPG